jgi:hypothetical protein
MSNAYMKKWMMLLMGVALLALLGCAAPEPYDYQPTAGEMKEGPGVLTGDSGELTLYDSQQGGLLPKDGEAAQKDQTTTVAQSPESSKDSPAQAQEFEEFQEFQQWKNEKQEFRHYQEWKKSDRNSADFKEFQEYQKWKQAPEGSQDFEEFQQWKEWKSYQEWKKSKGQ